LPSPPLSRALLCGPNGSLEWPQFELRHRHHRWSTADLTPPPWLARHVAPPCVCMCAPESPGHCVAGEPLTGDRRAFYRRRATARSLPPAIHASKHLRWSRAPLQPILRLVWVSRARRCPHRRPRPHRRRVTADGPPSPTLLPMTCGSHMSAPLLFGLVRLVSWAGFAPAAGLSPAQRRGPVAHQPWHVVLGFLFF
jgi:hypothetical protein